jgi:hypothetical protein
MGTLVLIRNAPDPGDDPENRYDCDACAHAPAADEMILLLLVDGDVDSKWCIDCAIEKLTGPVPTRAEEGVR